MEESAIRVFGKADHFEPVSARASVNAVFEVMRRCVPLFALLATCSSLAFCQSVLNFGFETGRVAPWIVWSGSNATIVTSTVHSGSYALSMSGAANTFVVQNVSGLITGQQYLVSAWVDVTSSNTAILNVDDSVSSATAQQVSQGATSGWQFISVPFTADSSDAINIHLLSSSTGAIYWDDISVVPAPPVSNYSFETGSLSPWTKSSGSNATIVQSPVHSGSYALSMSGAADTYVVQTVSGLTAGQQYIVSAWVNVASSNTALLNVDDSVNSATAQQVSQGQTSGWQFISVPFTADSSDAMNVHLLSAGTGAIYWDDVSVVPARPVSNYGFETGSVSPWTIYSGSNATVVKSPAHSGSYVLSMSGAGNTGVIQTVSGLTAGQQYVISAWVNVASSNSAVLYVDDSVSNATYKEVWQGQTNGWQLISVPFTADSSNAMNVHLWSASTGAIYWDDFSIATELVFASTTFPANNFRLSQGESVYVGPLTLVMQGDGNLVVYRGGTALWNTGTGGQNCGTNQCFAVFQGDGNFVVYNGSTALWASGTAGNSGAELVLSATSPYIDVVNTGEAILWSSSGPPLSPSNPSREFIYFGGQLIAVENHP